ncbi:MAG: hypothetical protein DBY14_03650 [Escherichia coli]|nr:MAG: hypothetical protein DBY14_03650 [Escherichia coli]
MNKINYHKKMFEIIEKKQKEGVKPSLLLHSCCAPCSSHCIDLLKDYFNVTVFYYNPNISAEDEYIKRKNEQIRFIKEFAGDSVSFFEGEHDSRVFFDAVKGFEKCKEGFERCFICYELRLFETAKKAKELGFDYFCTTLTVSPLKNSEKLNEIGQKVSEKIGVEFLPSDFKKAEGYKHSIELSKQYNLYRQNYCGCIFSKRGEKDD